MAEPRATPAPISAVLADGSTTDELPTWQHLTFTSVSGSLATIDSNGDLNFGALGGNATVEVTVTIESRIGRTVYLGYAWGGGSPTELTSHLIQSVLPETVSGTIITMVGGTLALYVSAEAVAGSPNTIWNGGSITFTEGSGIAFFPAFIPIIPPPVIGGTPPAFPPPAIPPPAGPLVGPAIAYAPVPPSVAGFPQPQFATGSATTPPANGYFEEFTSVFPVPTIVIDNVLMDGSSPPPQTASTENIVENGWGPFVPPGAPTSPGSDGRLPRP